MANLKIAGKRCQTAIVILLLLVLLLAVYGQAQAGQSEEKQKAVGESSATAQAKSQTTESAAPEQQKISPQEAEKLFRSVDEILRFASKDTLYPIKREVKRQLVSRDQVESYVSRHTRE